MAFYGSIAEANRLQNDLDAQEAGYADYADMMAQQGGSPWAQISQGEQVDVWSTISGPLFVPPPEAELQDGGSLDFPIDYLPDDFPAYSLPDGQARSPPSRSLLASPVVIVGGLVAAFFVLKR
jgi:hypothetical protein